MKEYNLNDFDHQFGVNESELFRANLLVLIYSLCTC